jgi:hypothetical protein
MDYNILHTVNRFSQKYQDDKIRNPIIYIIIIVLIAMYFINLYKSLLKKYNKKKILSKMDVNIYSTTRGHGYYIGQTKNGKAHGKGICFWKKGKKHDSVYQGQWVSNKMHGYGKINNINGFEYKGRYENGKKDGYGKMIFGKGKNEGAVYKGQFKNDKRDGLGVLISKNRNVYEGSWIKGKQVKVEKITLPYNECYQ